MAASVSSCVTGLGASFQAYNLMMSKGWLCDELEELNLISACPPTPAELNEIDRLVLCSIMCCCAEDPNIASNGTPRYQNCVAATINRGNSFGDMTGYRVLPEVSYDMRFLPPKPVGKNGGSLTGEYTLGQMLPDEDKNAYEARTGRRRPDVVVKQDPNFPPETGNIERIYEFKYPNDRWGDGQEEAYIKIAGGDESKVIEMTLEECCDSDDGEKVMEGARATQNSKAFSESLGADLALEKRIPCQVSY